MKTEQKVAQALINEKKSLGIAESCTGGLLAHRLTNIPGSSAFLKLGLITYSNEAKIKLLGIPKDLIKKHGVVSQQVALAMAKGVRQKMKTDFGIGITGIAGPTGATKTKPIGLTFIAVEANDAFLCIKCRFKGSREQIKKQATTSALRLILGFLN